FRLFFFFFQAEDGIRDFHVTGVQTCALPISETMESPSLTWVEEPKGLMTLGLRLSLSRYFIQAFSMAVSASRLPRKTATNCFSGLLLGFFSPFSRAARWRP